MINRLDINRKTLYGADIISDILRKEYPEDEIVMSIKGRDCGICRNPFDGGNRTLKVWIEKLHPEQKLSDEICRYHDLSGNLPDGDAFDFAARYYSLDGQPLLERINTEMHLHIGEPFRQYASQKDTPKADTPEEQADNQPRFSFYRAPIKNTVPEKTITLMDAFQYITGEQAKPQTEHLRSIEDKKQARAYKSTHFDYATFSGEFEARKDDRLIRASNLFSIDLDHLPDVEGTFQKLLADPYFETALLFRSPSGDGLKWIVTIDYEGHTHAQMFAAISQYLQLKYGVEMDQACKDISRACYLPHDPRAYINPSFKV